MHPANELPDGYELRAPRPDEVGDVARLNAVCDAAVGSPPSLTEDLLRQMWNRPGFDLATDAWVVEGDGDPIGCAQLRIDDPGKLSAFAIVHPEHLGRGIGSMLAAVVEDRAEELLPAGGRLLSAALTQDEAGGRLLAARGYRFARRFWHME